MLFYVMLCCILFYAVMLYVIILCHIHMLLSYNMMRSHILHYSVLLRVLTLHSPFSFFPYYYIMLSFLVFYHDKKYHISDFFSYSIS